MEKEFVPYELAIELKELGFDEQSLAGYREYGEGNIRLIMPTNKPFLNINDFGYKKYSPQNNHVIKATLWQQSFDWFRKNHKLEFILNNCSNKDHNLYDVVIYDICKKKKHEDYVIRNGSKFYTTYEEARLECLKKLIELCKK